MSLSQHLLNTIKATQGNSRKISTQHVTYDRASPRPQTSLFLWINQCSFQHLFLSFSPPEQFLSFRPGRLHHSRPHCTFWRGQILIFYEEVGRELIHCSALFQKANPTVVTLIFSSMQSCVLRYLNLLLIRMDTSFGNWWVNENLKAQSSFSLGVPADVTSIAIKNSYWK